MDVVLSSLLDLSFGLCGWPQTACPSYIAEWQVYNIKIQRARVLWKSGGGPHLVFTSLGALSPRSKRMLALDLDINFCSARRNFWLLLGSLSAKKAFGSIIAISSHRWQVLKSLRLFNPLPSHGAGWHQGMLWYFNFSWRKCLKNTKLSLIGAKAHRKDLGSSSQIPQSGQALCPPTQSELFWRLLTRIRRVFHATTWGSRW